MKKTCLALLAASALPAFAALDIASVDIEGIKLGMKGEEAAALVKAYCEKTKNGKHEEQPITMGNINLSSLACGKEEFDVLLLDSKTVAIFAAQKIDLNDTSDKDFINNWQLAVREKAVQKYGEPSLETNSAVIALYGEEIAPSQRLLCWGECDKTQASEPTKNLFNVKNVLKVKGQGLFIGLNINGSKAVIIRTLVDEAATATQKNTSQTEAEKAAAKVNL